MKKINKRDERFARLIAESTTAPGFCYAKSRDREYKGFNDDYQAEKLLKDSDIAQAVNTYRNHILSRDVLSRQEALVRLTAIFRAPTAAEIFKEINKLNSKRLDKEVKESLYAALDMSGIKRIKTTKYGVEVVGYDLDTLAARIMQLAGVDINKPISEEGKRTARRLLSEIFGDMGS
ncbi:hypothetical protein [Klebsiella aerogenes]|uniref:hypothetical protein n=1 Tax=Klebsiella aerogenes TaxID=548 RepID=UPI0005EDB096|nr:hypothetical protein [Klebsiella aerogenes]KJO49448.1 hypothetical protein SR89_23250 [Klebsiella aerogenes]KKY64145.1 hypothetical protein OA41_20375 [Klebsiella aerogenes]